jgi:hypothetical protein
LNLSISLNFPQVMNKFRSRLDVALELFEKVDGYLEDAKRKSSAKASSKSVKPSKSQEADMEALSSKILDLMSFVKSEVNTLVQGL